MHYCLIFEPNRWCFLALFASLISLLLCSFQKILHCVNCKTTNKTPAFCTDDGCIVAVMMLEVFKTKMPQRVQRHYPHMLCVFYMVHSIFFHLNGKTGTATLYFPSSTVPNPQTPSKHALSSPSHIVFPTSANLPTNSISPL